MSRLVSRVTARLTLTGLTPRSRAYASRDAVARSRTPAAEAPRHRQLAARSGEKQNQKARDREGRRSGGTTPSASLTPRPRASSRPAPRLGAGGNHERETRLQAPGPGTPSQMYSDLRITIQEGEHSRHLLLGRPNAEASRAQHTRHARKRRCRIVVEVVL